MFKVKLTRPLAVFDIEATGISPRADRIIELAIVKIMPDGTRNTHVFNINPQMPIPADSIRIHGITDADVADCPTFADSADEIDAVFEDCDLCGYNVLRFDIPMLCEEFIRAGKTFEMDNRRVIDPQRIYHRREPRTLTAALSFYAGEEHLDAHGAEPDVIATIKVLEGQIDKYGDIPLDIDALDEYCNPRDPYWVDRTGRLKWNNGTVVINFGRKKGVFLKTLVAKDPNFIKWMLKSDFPLDTREIVENAVNGTWPTAPKED